MPYYHQGIQVNNHGYMSIIRIITLQLQLCQITFFFLHGIGKRRLDNVQLSHEHDGLTSRTHSDVTCRSLHLVRIPAIEGWTFSCCQVTLQNDPSGASLLKLVRLHIFVLLVIIISVKS